jgi:hypothetical protein
MTMRTHTLQLAAAVSLEKACNGAQSKAYRAVSATLVCVGIAADFAGLLLAPSLDWRQDLSPYRSAIELALVLTALGVGMTLLRLFAKRRSAIRRQRGRDLHILKEGLSAGALAAAIAMLAACAGADTTPVPVSASPLNATYRIHGQSVALREHAIRPMAPGSATGEAISVWEGTPLYGDLDGDGDADAALALAQDLGSSGAFSYLVAALRGDDDYEGSNAIFLGDGIDRPQVSIEEGSIRVRFKDRPDGAPSSDPASRERALEAKVRAGQLEAKVSAP